MTRVAINLIVLVVVPGCASRPSDQVVTRRPELTYDASRTAMSGPRTFQLNDTLNFRLRNLNPFVHQYRVRTTEQAIVETAPAQYLQIAWGLVLPVPTSAQAVPRVIAPELDPSFTPSAALAQLTRDRVNCPGGRDAAEELEAVEAQDRQTAASKRGLPEAFRSLTEHIQDFNSRHSALSRRMHRTGLASDRIRMAAQLAADALRSHAAEMDRRLAAVQAPVDLFSGHVRTYLRVAYALSSKYPACHEFDRFVLRADSFAIDTTQFKAAVAIARPAAATARTNATAIERTLDDEGAFIVLHELGPYEGSTQVTVSVERRQLSGDTTYRQVAQALLRFGDRRRISVGAGVAVVDLSTFEYAIQRATNSADSTEGTIEISEQHSNRVVPLVNLYTRLIGNGTGQLSGLHATLGSTLRRDAGDTLIEFMIGAGASFLEDRLYVTAGFYLGSQKQLIDGLSVGQRLRLSDVVRTNRQLVGRPALMLGFRAL